MTALAPATKTSELMQKASALLLDSSKHHSMDEWSHKQLEREAYKLMHADAFGAHLLLGKLHESCGDVEKMRYHYQNASKIGSRVEAAGFLTAGLVNTGNFSEAQEHYRLVADPAYGRFLSENLLGFACFAIGKASESLGQAKKMQLDMTDFPSDTLFRMTEVMEKTDMTDKTLAEMLDVAGSIMRKHKLFYQNALPDILIDDDSDNPCIYATYRFDISASEAADLYDELAHVLSTRPEPIPDGFHISFRSM